LCLLLLALSAGGASGGDLAPWGAPAAAPAQIPAPAAPDPANRYEVRVGAFAHGIHSVESNTVDINAEFVTPRLPLPVAAPWHVLVPRLYVGGNANLSGRTSFIYGGLLLTLPLGPVFLENFIGAAGHNGELSSTLTHAGLGCSVLFHLGGSVGYRFDQNWSVMGTFAHVSNGRESLRTNCGTNLENNQGLNNYGVRLAFTF
jgi:hypothetical protein